MGIEAVIFDWGGTLTPWHTVDFRVGWQEVARALDPGRVAELADRLVAAEEKLWERSRTEHRSATLAELFALAELAAAELDRTQDAVAELYSFWEPHTYLDPDVPPLFAGLRERGIKIGVLSNTMWSRAAHERVFRRDRVLDLIDGAVYSSEIPWTKPHPDAFGAALDAVGVRRPDRAVYVGDRLFEDVFGAQAVGMRAVLVPHSAIPSHQRGHTEGTPDAVVQRLAEVLEVVDGWQAAGSDRGRGR
jgi:putative hydrolase of the HAD superfamily